MSKYNINDVYQKLDIVEKDIENLSNMVRHLHTKMDKLDKILESKNPEEAKVKFLEDSYTKIKKHIEGYENA